MNILEENELFLFWEEEGIICCLFKTHSIDLEMAKNSVATRLRLTNNQPYKLYVDLRNLKFATQETRNYFATEEAMYLAEAAAAYTPSILSKIIALFFLNFNKPRKPFKIFNSKEKAFEWLKSLEIK